MADQRHGTSHRGFASMDQDKQRAIAAKGDAPPAGNAHEFSPAEAREAAARVARQSAATASTWPRSAAKAGARHANARRQQQQAAEPAPATSTPQRQQG